VRGGTLAISLAVHVVVLVVIAQWAVLDEPIAVAPEPKPPAIELFVPIEVALVEPEASSGSVGEPGAAPAGHVEVMRAIASSDHVIDRSEPTTGVPDRPNPLAMRGLRHDLALPGHIVDGILGGKPAETPPPVEDPRWAPDPKLGKLVPSGGGKLEVRDRVATFKVAPDGTVGIVRKPDFTFRLNLPRLGSIHRAISHEIIEWQKDPYRHQHAGPMQDLPRHLTAVVGACEKFDDTWCDTAEAQVERDAAEDEDRDPARTGSGKADITGYLHRKLVGDPYASRKLKILDTTRDERVRIGTRYRAEQLDRSAELIQRNIEAAWRTLPDATQRRAALFAIWDECGEGEGTVGAAGQRARAMVIGWIRAHLPDGQPGAYTVAEVAQLNAQRSSKQAFAPY
jgi:hypothetical protein